MAESKRLFEKSIDPKSRLGFKSNPEIVEYIEKPIVVYPDPEDKELFFVSFEVVESQRISRRKFVNSFSGDVGVLNVVKKLAMQGEDWRDGKFAVKKDSYFDSTMIPVDGEGMINLAAAKQKIWASLDPELKGTMTFEDFASSFDEKKLTDYLKAKIAKKTSTKVEPKVEPKFEPKVEEKEGE